MDKRDTIRENLIALTRADTDERAMRGWEVVSTIRLSDGAEQIPCELCKTRFRRGAWVNHPRHEPKIAVGGTCLQTLLLGAFPDTGVTRPRPAMLTAAIKSRYAGRLSAGDWKNWVLEHARDEHAREATELEAFGMTQSEDGLEALIAFHDRHRLFPSEALVDGLDDLPERYWPDDTMTIEDARALVARLTSRRTASKIVSESLRAHIDDNTSRWASGADHTWRRLDPSARSVIASLDVLAGDDSCASKLAELADGWEHMNPVTKDAWCWHPKTGVGYIEPEDGTIWLSHSGDHIRVRDRALWHTVSGADPSDVREMTALAFGPRLSLKFEHEAG